jgi:hypothetical protein
LFHELDFLSPVALAATPSTVRALPGKLAASDERAVRSGKAGGGSAA